MKNYLVIVLSFLLITSCTKEGTGGKASVSGFVKHADQPIGNSTVYLKYGATELPGTNPSDFDEQMTTGADGKYEFNNLKKGDYYLYATGFDPAHAQTSTGGTAVTLKRTANLAVDIHVGH